MGINDLGGTYGQPNLDELLAEIMSSYFAQLSILYITGLRKFILLAVPREFIRVRSSYYSLKPNVRHYSHAADSRFYRPRERSY